MKNLGPRIIIALDHSTDKEVLAFVEQLNPTLCRLKIGSILFTHYGPSLIEKLMQRGFSVFLDLKFHDIPQTVAGACRSAAELGVWMVNVHVSGGRDMLMAARQALDELPKMRRPLLIGVTILTSLSAEDLLSLGQQNSVQTQVLRLALLAHETGLNGVVCSAQEAELLRGQLPADFLLVTPGIRLSDDAVSDQKRVMTPEAAWSAGADYLVIGRSITQAIEPLKVLEHVNQLLHNI